MRGSKYGGIYSGLVIDNYDPEFKGRVKVVVDEVTNIKISDTSELPLADQVELLGGYTADEIAIFKDVLPYADVAQGLFGGGGNGGGRGGLGGLGASGGTNYYGNGASFSGVIEKNGNKVEETSFFNFLTRELEENPLYPYNNGIPKDGARWGINTGSTDEWVNLLMNLCKAESSFVFGEGQDGDGGRSRGLFQLSYSDGEIRAYNSSAPNHFTPSQLYNPVTNSRIALRIMRHWLKKSGGYIRASRGGKDGHGGLGAYWGPIRGNYLKVPNRRPIKGKGKPSATNVPSAPRGGVETDTPHHSPSTRSPIQNQTASNTSSYKVSTDNQRPSDKQLLDMGIPVELNFSSSKNGGFITIPKGLSGGDKQLIEEYVKRCNTFFKSKSIGFRLAKVSIVEDAGKNGFIHTNMISSVDDVLTVMDNPVAYTNILKETLGKIQSVIFTKPSTNTSIEQFDEQSFAEIHLLTFLNTSKNKGSKDAFSTVANGKHPEEVALEELFKDVGIKDSIGKQIIANEKALYESKQTAKPNASNIGANAYLQERDKLWKMASATIKDKAKRKIFDEYKESNSLDFKDIPANKNANLYADSYTSGVTDTSSGSFSIPKIGATVWVMFESGDKQRPVVMGLHPTKEDYNLNFGENSIERVRDPVTDGVVGGVHVTSNRASTTKFNETDGNVSTVTSHYNGNVEKHDKAGKSTFIVGQDSALIKGDAFKTVRGSKNHHVDGDTDGQILGNVTIRCGNVHKAIKVTQQIQDRYASTHDVAAEFSTTRPSSDHPLDGPRYKIPFSIPMPCVKCSSIWSWKPTINCTPKTFIEGRVIMGIKLPEILIPSIALSFPTKQPRATCPECKGSGISNTSALTPYPSNPKQLMLPVMLAGMQDDVSLLDNQLGSGGNKTEYITKTSTLFVGGAMNTLNSVRVDPIGASVNAGVESDVSGKVTGDYNVAVPHMEHVAVPSMGGGDLLYNIANSFKTIVGSGGITNDTFGKHRIQGRIMTVMGDHVVISSNNKVTIDGGKALILKGGVISLNPTSVGGKKSIGLNGTVGVTGNMNIKGGLMVEGPTHIQSLTTVSEMTSTETTVSDVHMKGGVQIAIAPAEGMPIMTLPGGVVIGTSAHSHAMQSMPVTFVSTNDDVRRSASMLQYANPVLAKGVGDSFLPKLALFIALIAIFDPSLFGLFDDCEENDVRFQELMDRVLDGSITKEEARTKFRKTSDFNTQIGFTKTTDGCDPCK